MKFSIIIPAFNEERLLGDSLAKLKESLQVLNEAGESYELILCDNHSTDRTAEIAQAQGARVIYEPINQISRARNTGASIASGDYFVFIDADSYPPAELFEELLARIKQGNVVGGGALVDMKTRGGIAFLTLHLWRAISRICLWAPGSFIFARADIFRKLGGFSTELFASEEIDFSKRLKREAHRLGKDHAQVIILRHSILTSNRKLYLYGIGDYLKLGGKFLFHGKKLLRKRDALPVWYDGRR